MVRRYRRGLSVFSSEQEVDDQGLDVPFAQGASRETNWFPVPLVVVEREDDRI